MATWPSGTASDPGPCHVLKEGYTQSLEPNVRRTEFEDGTIAQKTRKSRRLMVRSFSFLVVDSELPGFFDWLRENADDWFDFTDLDGETRQVRVRGGSGAVRVDQQPGVLTGRHFGGDAYHRGQVELEGYI